MVYCDNGADEDAWRIMMSWLMVGSGVKFAQDQDDIRFLTNSPILFFCFRSSKKSSEDWSTSWSIVEDRRNINAVQRWRNTTPLTFGSGFSLRKQKNKIGELLRHLIMNGGMKGFATAWNAPMVDSSLQLGALTDSGNGFIDSNNSLLQFIRDYCSRL